MRIDPKSPVSPITLDKDATTPAKQAARGPSSVVTLSSAGAAASAEPDAAAVTARLARVRELISRGAYAVDLDKLASRIVEDEALRLGGK